MSTEGKFAFAAAVFALVALAIAVATAAASFVIHRHDRQRIHSLQREVAVLCGRRVVTGLETKSLGHITVQTQTGC
ncbi:MAG TPA: hypothetical protein VHC69_00935 [Polyangiaceae bacterium]|jgi:hypothetical protein|nr:hypothetical protein [Polyangiaceae bacterium]